MFTPPFVYIHQVSGTRSHRSVYVSSLAARSHAARTFARPSCEGFDRWSLSPKAWTPREEVCYRPFTHDFLIKRKRTHKTRRLGSHAKASKSTHSRSDMDSHDQLTNYQRDLKEQQVMVGIFINKYVRIIRRYWWSIDLY